MFVRLKGFVAGSIGLIGFIMFGLWDLGFLVWGFGFQGLCMMRGAELPQPQ